MDQSTLTCEVTADKLQDWRPDGDQDDRQPCRHQGWKTTLYCEYRIPINLDEIEKDDCQARQDITYHQVAEQLPSLADRGRRNDDLVCVEDCGEVVKNDDHGSHLGGRYHDHQSNFDVAESVAWPPIVQVVARPDERVQEGHGVGNVQPED